MPESQTVVSQAVDGPSLRQEQRSGSLIQSLDKSGVSMISPSGSIASTSEQQGKQSQKGFISRLRNLVSRLQKKGITFQGQSSVVRSTVTKISDDKKVEPKKKLSVKQILSRYTQRLTGAGDRVLSDEEKVRDRAVKAKNVSEAEKTLEESKKNVSEAEKTLEESKKKLGLFDADALRKREIDRTFGMQTSGAMSDDEYNDYMKTKKAAQEADKQLKTAKKDLKSFDKKNSGPKVGFYPVDANKKVSSKRPPGKNFTLPSWAKMK